MKAFLVLLNLLFNSISCHSKTGNTKISLYNRTVFNLDSVKVTSYGVNLKFENIKPNQKIDKTFYFGYNGDMEGAFNIEIFIKDSLKSSSGFGYFENSHDIKQNYNVTIFDDLKIKESE